MQPQAWKNELAPIKMADFVTEVTEQSPIGLVHGQPTLLALRVVRLGQVDGNHSLGVARQNWRRFSSRPIRIGEKAECQPTLGIFALGYYRQPQGQEAVNKPPL